MPRGYMKNPKPRNCGICGASFTPAHHSQRFCSRTCRRQRGRDTGCETTESQYALVSGNWAKYYNRLRCQKGRQGLQLEDLIALHAAQQGRCALSGVEMTCILVRGMKCPTNASLDRIDPKGPYSMDNLQLVCAAVNRFRVDTSVSDFIEWCRKVATHAVQKP